MGIFKKSSHSHDSSVLRRILYAVLILVICGLVLGGFWFLSMLGPKEVDYYDVQLEEQNISEEIKELESRSRELEVRFEELLSLSSPGPEAIILVKEAMELQERYVDAVQGFDAEAIDRRDRLRRKYQNLAADVLKAKSIDLESAAEELERSKDYAGAESRYQEALQTQQEINDDYPLSTAYNASRAAFLQRKAKHVRAEPILLESLALEVEADALIKSEKWSLAENKLSDAIALQDRLNREFRGSTQANLSRLQQLSIKLVTIRSGQNQIEIERLLQLADQRRGDGEMLEAASLYDEAVRLQKELNKKFPESPYASSDKVIEYERKSQTAQSFSLGVEIEEQHDLLRRLLADRRAFEAAEVIVNLQKAIRQMSDAYPKSSLNDEDLQLKIRYLSLLQSDLDFIQERVTDALTPIPEEKSWQMLRTEVTQALYSLIMGTNPSRNIGDQNPVDSVSWTEAKQFCERLSWIMGKSVRLPTENEFRQALGRLRYVVLEKHVWSAADSGDVAHQVGTKEPFESGIYDLLGNVSEWLESSDRLDIEDTQHIGGHAQDRLETIFTVPVRDAPRGERNRMTGFRFVVMVN